MMDTLLSRPASTNGIGKNSEEVKSLVPPEIKEELAGLAFVAGMTLSEYVREVLIVHTRGAVHAVRVRHRAMGGMAETGRE